MAATNLDAELGQFQKYQNKGIIVDSNLLILFFAGLASVITDCRAVRNHGFQNEDFELLLRIIRNFKTIVTTPHILTEVSNHSEDLKGAARIRFCRTVALALENCQEVNSTLSKLSRHDSFIQFGLTDTAIEETAAGSFFVISADARLVANLKKKKIAAVNYHHIRHLARP